jgi:PAS domain S-box-containing protein
MLLTWNLDITGLTRSYEVSVKKARAICPAPLYSVWEFYFGKGIVGGSLLDGHIHGQEVGDLAKRVLAGESPDSIPVVTQCRTTLTVDYREIERFSINTRYLPNDAEVHYRTLSVWEQHTGIIIATGLVIALQGLTISWLIVVIQRRRQARARLRESETYLRLTLNSIDEAVIVADTQNRITSINPAAEKLTGLSSDQAKNQPLHVVVPLIDLQSDQSITPLTLVSLHQDREKSRASRARLKSRTGAESIVVHSTAPMLDNKGTDRGVVMVLRDITAQQHLEEQLYQAQKMESIGQLAGGIAHDFNNILAIIVGHGELLRDEVENQPAALEDLQVMMRGAQRATDLVQQILAFSRKTRHEMTPTLLQTVLKEALRFIRSTVPSTIEIAPRISTDLPLVLADATQIHQVIMNLCANAAHAMKGAPNGRLEVRLESMHADAEFAVMHTGLREGEYVRLSVSDTGHGMDEKTLQHIFEPFFTTKVQGEGTGLGLSVVHGIVKAHNGGIFVYSRPGEGTIFHIYLPALSIARNTGSTSSVQVQMGKGEHILFVDDEPAICASARRIIENLGYHVSIFNNPLLALESIKDSTVEIDLLVTDLTMPGATGINLANAARQIRPDLPVVLATGFAADMTEPTVQKHGIGQLLIKPFTTASLAQVLSEALRQKRT